MEPTVQPTEEFLEQSPNSSGIFSLQQKSESCQRPSTPAARPDIDPPLTALERRGKERFDFFCAKCHGGPSQTQNLENRVSPPFDGSTNPVSLNVVVSNPPPTGFPLSPIQGPGFDLPAQRFTVALPNGTSVVLVSSDPGTAAHRHKRARDRRRQPGIQPLRRPATPGHQQDRPILPRPPGQDVRGRSQDYQQFFFFINVVRGFPLPQIPDEDIVLSWLT